MSEFRLFLTLGLDHILDIKGIDHILFIIAMCSLYTAANWKKVLILITAFTIGHSITLILATLGFIRLNASLVEFLIPLTILITSILNLFYSKKSERNNKLSSLYMIALVFGLIHGLGFSNYLRSLLGSDHSIILQLFAFNVGLEIGQIIIVAIYLMLASILINQFKVNRKKWRVGINLVIALSALIILIQNSL